MVINENNSYINSFSKGMNSDITFDLIQNTQYIYAKNIRITKNQLLGGASEYSTLHEGIVAPVYNGMLAALLSGILMPLSISPKILAVNSVENICVIISREYNNLCVHKVLIDETLNKITYSQKIWVAVDYFANKELHPQVSTVLYKELDNVIKLYIATGEDPIISLRVDDYGVNNILKHNNLYTPIDYLINNRIMPENRVYIDNVISGHLKTLQVQYTYRYYNKYLNTTQLAPLTNKIQIIDPSRFKENGNAEDSETSLGLALKIDTTEFNKWYDCILIFRLSYIHPGEDAEVSLIYDDDIKLKDDGFFYLNDVGIQPLKTLTMEEFSSMSGLLLIPQVISLNLQYVFEANVKDDTIIRNISIDNNNKNLISTISTKILLSLYTDGRVPILNNEKIVDCTFSNNVPVKTYIELRDVNPNEILNNYNNIFTSSLLRSLRRGETYKYGIVFYDNKGRRSDVLNLGDITIQEIDDANMPFEISNDKLYAKSIGVSIEIPDIKFEKDSNATISDIIGCLIVRRSSKEIYQKNILQVALSRPISQGLSEVEGQIEPNKYSPFYPSGFLSVNDINIFPMYYSTFWDRKYSSDTDNLHAMTRNLELYLIFSAEIDFARNDILSRLNVSDTTLKELFYIPGECARYTGAEKDTVYGIRLQGNVISDLVYADELVSEITYPFRGVYFAKGSSSVEYPYHSDSININRLVTEKLSPDLKSARSFVFNYYNSNQARTNSGILMSSVKIKAIKDVKIPEWNSAFSEVLFNDDGAVVDAIKRYKQYNTTIDKYIYNNFVSFCKYDLTPGALRDVNQHNENEYSCCEIMAPYQEYKLWSDGDHSPRNWTVGIQTGRGSDDINNAVRNGYIGGGTSCFLVVTEKEMQKRSTYTDNFFTSVCNIQHVPLLNDVESDETVLYFGFGNYFNLKLDSNDKLVLKDGSKNLIVFDGDIYITPHEFTTMHKVYNFESTDTLQSTLITNYIPLESKVNTYFDYGMNLLNTNSSNLLYEPGSIDGVTTQERPLHQYNMIYSDNDASNDVFTLITTDENETNNFKLRAYYSEPKINGEFIDNFLIFKPAAFIDVDSSYGLITNLLSDKNNLYYWQDHAFGKFSVNERSLVNDLNGNTIMLGQAGILSRYDYLSTKYGMRLYDFCSRSTENGIYWVDINNKGIIAADDGKVVNYGEYVGVQNIINNNLTEDVPKVDYDLLNNELLCKCFGEEQLVFNVKYNMATSIYTRDYRNMTYIKNHLYGITVENNKFTFNKHNYLQYSSDFKDFLAPIQLYFIVNPNSSITKTFDSLLIVPIKRSTYLPAAFNNSKLEFDTDIYSPTTITMNKLYTDREGNLIYNVPRLDNANYGNRIRGKWMLVKFKNNSPTQYVTLSHVITKYRLSFS